MLVDYDSESSIESANDASYDKPNNDEQHKRKALLPAFTDKSNYRYVYRTFRSIHLLTL